ncbi:MAG: D-alanyl-D-alanine dipeptidase [Elusimicrobiota bacterium]|nr:D-alanyl-D-alanine dipeptidase [Elusimicrobiota bacterium]
MALIAVLALVPDAVLDLRYATADNFVGRPLYPVAAALLRRPAAERLAKAAAILRADGLRLVVYDAYRPLSAQRAMWAAKPDARFVADPKKGSSHNRGGAVDAGLADARGRPLPMPTDFDDFGPKAAHGAKGVSPAAARNAARLKAAMEAAGFVSYAAEWWHYRDPDATAWPLLDEPLTEVAP